MLMESNTGASGTANSYSVGHPTTLTHATTSNNTLLSNFCTENRRKVEGEDKFRTANGLNCCQLTIMQSTRSAPLRPQLSVHLLR